MRALMVIPACFALAVVNVTSTLAAEPNPIATSLATARNNLHWNLSRSSSLSTYARASDAQKHCPSDTVVHFDPFHRIWYLKRAPTAISRKHSVFACAKEAISNGAHEAANDQ